MKIKVYRFNEKMDSPSYDTFDLEPKPGMTVMSALFQFQEKFDDSLSFHYSCRGAVCGTCAMLINKVPRLACRTQIESLLKGNLKVPIFPYPAIGKTISWDPEKEVLVEPLPHLPVIKDLIVDMDLFFKFYRFIEPTFKPVDFNSDEEMIMYPVDVKKLQVYTNCILCAACFGGCPIVGQNPKYLGPAALAKLYRFHIDPREAEGISRLKIADIPNGWWACESYGNCFKVCPKGVPPIKAIEKAVDKLNNSKKSI
ncbi:MAG: succinate dehydrogenase/fumarate reductase iron-sulfur subunit [Methanobacterium sp.]|nr:succinate dehydrogenase/fumarate reductase iron-sulfur subunit [Methanobacterium sp.]